MESVASFLAKVAPFSLLESNERDLLSKKMLIEYFPIGSIILRRDLDTPDYLYIIRKGRVRLTKGRQGENERLVSLCGEGDIFGATSLLEGEAFVFNATTDDDTICYLFSKSDFLDLISTSQKCADYFSSTLSVSLSNAYQAKRDRFTLSRNVDEISMLFQSVSKLIKRKPIVCTPEITIREAAEVMTLERVGSIVVVNENKKPEGIITDTDFRTKVISKNLNTNIAVGEIMSKPLVTIDADDTIMNALLIMTRQSIHHLCVVEHKSDEEHFLGIVSEHDLMLMHGVSPAATVKNLDRESTIEGLLSVKVQMDTVINSLIAQGITAKRLTHLITSFNDKLTERIISLAEQRMMKEGFGAPPVPYAWIAFGSEGREEQTFSTDQDNGIVFEDSSNETELQSYFLKLASIVVNDLDQVGFPKCKGNIMASNPELCGSLNMWKDNFSKWVFSSNPKALLNASIFFDFRTIHGEHYFLDVLQKHLFKEIDKSKQFYFFMIQNALQTKPPIGFFGSFTLEASGENKNKFNIKERALRPIIDMARLLGYQAKSKSSNTWSRLLIAKNKSLLRQNLLDNMIEAFDYMMTLRLTQHSEQRRKGIPPDNFIEPDQLSQIERNALKESFRVVEELQGELRDKFGGGMEIAME